MGPHGDGREYQAGAALDGKALDSIRIIAGPGLGHVVKHARIKAPAAPGAAFKKHLRESLGKALQHLIEPQHKAGAHFSLTLRGKLA